MAVNRKYRGVRLTYQYVLFYNSALIGMILIQHMELSQCDIHKCGLSSNDESIDDVHCRNDLTTVAKTSPFVTPAKTSGSDLDISTAISPFLEHANNLIVSNPTISQLIHQKLEKSTSVLFHFAADW